MASAEAALGILVWEIDFSTRNPGARLWRDTDSIGSVDGCFPRYRGGF